MTAVDGAERGGRRGTRRPPVPRISRRIACAAVSASARMAHPRLWWAAMAGSVVLLAVAVVALGGAARAIATATVFEADPCVGTDARSDPAACPGNEAVSVVGTTVVRHGIDGREPVVVVRSAGGDTVAFDAVFTTDVFQALVPGQHLTLINWRGAPRSLHTDASAAHPTGNSLWLTDNPLVDEWVLLWTGLVGLGCGALCLGLLVTAGRGAHAFSLRRAWTSRPLRWLVVLFLLTQVADVTTSVLGHAGTLYEGAAFTRGAVDALGPAGFAAVKIPGVAVLLLAAARLPSRIVAACLALLTAVYAAVVADNVHLLV